MKPCSEREAVDRKKEGREERRSRGEQEGKRGEEKREELSSHTANTKPHCHDSLKLLVN